MGVGGHCFAGYGLSELRATSRRQGARGTQISDLFHPWDTSGVFPPALAVVSVVAAAISAAGLLVLGRLDLAVPSARLAGLGLIVSAAVTVAGLVVARSRWAQRHAWLLLGGMMTISALSRPIDAWWAASLTIAAVAALVLGLRPVTAWLASVERRVPVPKEAVVLLLIMLDAPLLVAITHPEELNGVAVGASIASWLLLWGYSQAWVPALWALRLGLPLLAVGWGWGAAWWGWAAVACAGGVAMWLAWREGALLAAQPLEPRKVTGRPILAELAPEDVRNVAGIDERGRRL